MRASVAVLAIALIAVGCGEDEPDSETRLRRQAGRTLTVYSSLPLQGAQRPQTTDMVKGIELALEQAGGKAGDFTVKYQSLDDSTAQAGSWTPEATTSNARKAAQDDSTAIYIGEFNSGRLRGLDPDPQRGRRPADQPRQHGRRADLGRPGRRAGRAGQVLPVGSAHLRADRPQGHDPGRGARDRDEGGRLHQGPDDQRQGGLRRGAVREHRDRGRGPGPGDRLQRGDRQERAELPLARRGGRRRGRGLLHLLRHHRQQRGPALQGLRGRSAGREALRAGRRGRGRLRRSRARAASRPTWRPGSRSRSRPSRPTSTRRRARSSSTPSARSTTSRTRTRTRSTATRRCGWRSTPSHAPSTGDKADILAALFDTSDRESVLGTYSIDENGDTTLSDYGVYRVADGELEFDRTIQAQGG